jgi:hypothetical protein
VHQSADPAVVDGDPGWHDITLSAPTRIDLVGLTNGVLYSLGSTPLNAGTYQQLRLVLVPNSIAAPVNNAVVATGSTTEMALSTPSAVQSGIKLIQPFTVAAGTQVDLVLDFNACKSVVTAGNSGRFNLKPVLTMVPTIVSGSIEGWIDPTLAAATPVTVSAQVVDGTTGAVTEVKSTVAAPTAGTGIAAGQFILGPVPLTSAEPSPYNIVITAAGSATTVISGVSVASGAARVDVNTATTPLTLPTSATHVASGKAVLTGTTTPVDATVDALQSLTTTLPISVAATNTDASTGAYALTLPIAAARYAPFVASTTPLSFTTATTGVGQYTLLAVPASGTAQSHLVDLSAGDVMYDFAF